MGRRTGPPMPKIIPGPETLWGRGTEAKGVEIDVPHPRGNTVRAKASLGLRTPGGSQSGLTLAVL
jgi:hypothetical protein